MPTYPEQRFHESTPNTAPVYFVSADLPGCGSSTLVEGIRDHTESLGLGHHVVRIGEAVRQELGATNELELQQRLALVPDPKVFDEKFYGNLPIDQTCIIDGKLATTVGPQYVDPSSRQIISIDLTSEPLVSAKRITQREEHVSFPEIVLDPDRAARLLSRYSMIKARADHDTQMRQAMLPDSQSKLIAHHRINTSKVSKHELVGNVFNVDFTSHVPDWELAALAETAVDLAQTRDLFDGSIHPADSTHFRHQLEGVSYKTERLSLMLDPKAIEMIRADLKKTLVDAWSSIMMKNAPRFFRTPDNEIILDNKSQAWTPEFYKIAEAWPIMSKMLKGKVILDPFAGAGTLVNLLASRGIPAKAYVSDIAYEGGEPLDDDGSVYATELNRQMYEVLFDSLPSWYKPDHSAIEKPVTADVNALPMNDKSVDYIVSDPPYGKNHPGGIDLVVGALGEMARVTRKGSILLMPIEWVEQIRKEGYTVRQMTKDVSMGKSGVPTCYVYIDAKQSRKRK